MLWRYVCPVPTLSLLPSLVRAINPLTRPSPGRSREGLYEPVLADSEREAVADLLQYLENVGY